MTLITFLEQVKILLKEETIIYNSSSDVQDLCTNLTCNNECALHMHPGAGCDGISFSVGHA
jgi:hypothetical protein